MKAKIAAIIILAGLTVGVILNTVYLDKTIADITAEVEEFRISDVTESAAAEAERMFDRFKRRETYISTTVNHGDLTEIEGLMSEMVANLKEGKADEARVTKSRLIDALGHLRRLSGVNIDSII